MDNINIPPEAVEAAARELAPHPWSMYTDGAKAHFQAKATAAIRAALENWPGMGPIRTDQPIGDWCNKLPAIILPLSQEKQNG